MSELLTLEIPDDLAQRARALAAATNRRLEEAVVDWIGRAVAVPDVESLPDESLLALCDATIDAAQQEELSDLLARHREGELAESDRARLDGLMAVYRSGLVRKARALKEAVARGLRPRLDDDVPVAQGGRSDESNRWLSCRTTVREPMEFAQVFWNLFRERLRENLLKLRPDLTGAWTPWRTQSAVQACRQFAEQLGLGPAVTVRAQDCGGERRICGRKIDVCAEVGKDRFLVLFESELGRPGRSREPWTCEVDKLCEPWAVAELRVVSGVFGKGEGPGFRDILARWIDPMRDRFLNGPQGPFLFAFGAENMRQDPDQPWRAYYLDPKFRLHELDSEPPLILDHVLAGR